MKEVIKDAIFDLQNMTLSSRKEEALEKVIAETYISSKINELNREFGTSLIGLTARNASKKEILYQKERQDQDVFYLVREEVYPLFSIEHTVSPVTKLEIFRSFESEITEKMIHYSTVISANRQSLKRDVRELLPSVPLPVTFYSKPSSGIFGGDNGKEYIEFHHKGQFVHAIWIDLLERGHLTTEEKITLPQTLQALIVKQSEQAERQEKIQKQQHLHRLFFDLDPRHDFTFSDTLKGNSYDFSTRTIAYSFDFLNTSLVENIQMEYKGKIDYIQHCEQLTCLTTEFPVDSHLSHRYYFLLECQGHYQSKPFHLFVSRGIRNKTTYHVFMDGQKIKTTHSKKQALSLIGK